MKKKHGWILYDQANGESMSGRYFTDEESGFTFTSDITKARVHTTRRAARNDRAKLCSDTVKKVSLDKQGKAVKIIPGR